MISLPPSVITTPRLIIRRRDPSDAALFKDAVDSSLEHLSQWMPWANDEPTPLEALRERIAGFALNFDEGREFVYGILPSDESQALGCVGLHLRNEDTDREIGYWLRVSATGQGFITEAAAAVTTASFAAWPDIRTVTIICDPANARSAAVPARLGFSCLGNRPAKEPTPTRIHDQVWRVMREDWQSSAGNGQAAASRIQPRSA